MDKDKDTQIKRHERELVAAYLNMDSMKKRIFELTQENKKLKRELLIERARYEQNKTT